MSWHKYVKYLTTPTVVWTSDTCFNYRLVLRQYYLMFDITKTVFLVSKIFTEKSLHYWVKKSQLFNNMVLLILKWCNFYGYWNHFLYYWADPLAWVLQLYSFPPVVNLISLILPYHMFRYNSTSVGVWLPRGVNTNVCIGCRVEFYSLEK